MTPAWLVPDPDEHDGPCLCDVCGGDVPPVITQSCTKRKEWARNKRKDAPRYPRDLARERAKIPVGGGFTRVRVRSPSRPVICVECRLKGWRGRWCACGAVLHKRDYPQAHRKVGACGKCRAEMYELRRHDAA